MEATSLKFGENWLREADLVSLLHRYQLTPHLLKGMIIDKAIAPYPLTEVETATAIANFYAQHQLSSRMEQSRWRQDHQVTETELEERVTRSQRLATFKRETWGHQIKSTFLQRKSSLDQVIYSLLRTRDRGLAHELYYRIQEGEESFVALAKQFSEGHEAQTGGKMGPVPIHKLPTAVRNLLAVSQPQQLWFPLQVDDFFVILRLEKLLPAQFDLTMQQYLLDELFEQWLQETINLQLQQWNDEIEMRCSDANA